MDLTRLVRSIDQMQIRIKKLEEAVGDLAPVSVSTEVPDLFPCGAMSISKKSRYRLNIFQEVPSSPIFIRQRIKN